MLNYKYFYLEMCNMFELLKNYFENLFVECGEEFRDIRHWENVPKLYKEEEL